MKKFKSLKLMLLGVLALGSMNAFAQEKATTVWRYTVSGNDATLIGFVADLGDEGKANVTIPNQVTDPANANIKYTVKNINEDAFSVSNDKGKLKKLTIAATNLAAIPEKLIQGCGNLTELDLSKATGLKTIPDKAFMGTKIAALDLSKTKVNTIGNLFGTNYEYTATGGYYTQAEANNKNVEYLKSKSLPYVVEGDPVLTSGAFADYKEVNAYYKAWYAGAKQAGDDIPLDKSNANAKNASTYATCVKAGDNVVWTLEDALAWNVANVNGAMPAGYVLDDITVGVYNTTTGASKKSGAKLTANEAQAYNELMRLGSSPITYKKTLSGSDYLTDKVAVVGHDAFDENGDYLLYDDDAAYAYNMAAQPGCFQVGDESGVTFATHYEAWKWNNANVVPAGKQKGLGDSGEVPSGSYYTAATAYAENLSRVPTANQTQTGDSKASSKVAAVNNNSLKSLTLNNTWTTINFRAFENCTALATINFGTANKGVSQSVGNHAFLGSAITEVNLVGSTITFLSSDTFVDADQSYTKAKGVNGNTTLTSVKFNKDFTEVDDELFANCTALATVTFEDRDVATESEPGSPVTFKQPFYGVGYRAFAYTAIQEITIPQALDPTTKYAVDDAAFIGCTKLKKFTYMVDENWATVDPETVSQDAFPGCVKVAYVTTQANIAAFMDADLNAPKNTYFVLAADNDGYVTPFTPIAYKNNPNKYYIKYVSVGDIMVDKTQAKVYSAYVDAVDGSINMALYESVGGYYHIGNGDVALIITSNPNLSYEKSSYGSSMMSSSNDMYIVYSKEGYKRAELDYMAGADNVVYGWVNSAAGTGWQYITSGEVFPQGSLYIFGAAPADGSSVKVNWLDENGNIEAQTTGIESIMNVEETSNDAIYNLQGVQVKGAQKGIFIQNGKKYVK